MTFTCGPNLEIQGGKKLKGAVSVNSSKNGAVALLCASLLNRGTTTLHNVAQIEEVFRMLEVLESLGFKIERHDHSLTLTPPKKIALKNINQESARRTRSIVMFIGPLLSHFKTFAIPLAGGCKLGSRTVRPHLFALEKLGVSITTQDGAWHIVHKGLKAAEIVMYESGDTATENAVLAASGIPGTTTIKYASANYQVQELCFFLEGLGVKIEGIGTTTLIIHGIRAPKKNISYTLSEDPIDAMFWLAAAIVTKSSLVIKRAPIDFLEKELLVLEKMGFRYKCSKPYKSTNGRTRLIDITTLPSSLTAPEDKIHASAYPGLNMDNLPFFAVIATQAKGTTLIHDWVYEKRAIYLTELDRLGAETLLADPHRIFIEGPSHLRANDLMCPPALRPAVVLLVAMLAADGVSTLRNIYPIARGYEGLAEKLSSLGAGVKVAG